MAIDWFAPSVLAALVGAVSGLATNYVAEARRRRYDDRAKQDERLRLCAVALCDAATEVGEGKDSHERVRARYVELYLLTRRDETLRAARELVRTSWNVNEQNAGRPRKRPAPPNVAPSKEIRNQEFLFLNQVRKETGVDYPLPNLEITGEDEPGNPVSVISPQPD